MLLYLASLSAFLLPFKLNIAYWALIPLVLSWIVKNLKLSEYKLSNLYLSFQSLFEDKFFLKIFLAFIVCMVLSSCFGLNIQNSLTRSSSLFFYPLLILVFWQQGSNSFTKLARWSITGLTIAAFINVLRESAINLPSRFIGSVSQSGQISIVLFLVGALYFFEKKDDVLGQNLKEKLINFIVLLAIFFAVIFLGLTQYWNNGIIIAYYSLAVVIISILYYTIKYKTSIFSNSYFLISLPILTAALIVNMKRGPWLGVFVGLSLAALLLKKRWVILALATGILSALFFSPIQDRILQAKDHFFISGGRSEIWKIGFDLMQKYPLGIGYENSPLLREFSVTIPDNLKHFHSNIINIFVEGGWFTGIMFVWCIASATLFFVKKKSPLTIWFAAGIASWFTAGLVEYNFGDSAVCNILYIFIGLGLACVKAYPSSQSQN